MKEALFLFMGFLALALCGKLLYGGYSRLCGRLLGSGSEDGGKAAAGLLTGFSLCTLFILFMMAYSVAVAGLPLTLGSALLAGMLILAVDNLLILLGWRVSRAANRRDLDHQLLRQKQRTETDYYRALEEQYDRQRVLIHDIRKHLSAVRDLAGQEDSAAVARYVEELEASPALQRRARICGNHLLDVILCRCQEMCRDRGVSFTADVRDGAVDGLEQTDITALFGNLLENAVEAAGEGPGGYVELLADQRPGRVLMLSLVNTCARPPVEDGSGGYMTRKPQREQHGLGLKSVRDVVKKHGGSIRQYYEEETGLFHTVILI